MMNSTSALLDRLNEAQRIAAIGSWEWDLRSDDVWWSDETYRIFGVDPRDFVPSFETNGSFIHPDDFAAYGALFARCLRTGEPLDHDFRLLTSDGSLKYCNVKGRPIPGPSGEPDRFVGTIMDITERKLAEAALRESEAKYHIVADNTYDWEWWAAPDGTYVYVSPACERITGHSAAEFLAHPDLLLAITHPDDVAMVRNHLQDDFSHRSVADRLEFRILTTAGVERVIEHRCQDVVDADGAYLGHRGSNRDITERKRDEEEIKRQNRELLRLTERQLRVNTDLREETASLEKINARVAEIAAKDDLTGLANRRTFRDSMKKAVSMARRHHVPLALVSLDLDGLKRVNDSAGHAAGDEVLAAFAKSLGSGCRTEDLPARLGGDEFSLLLPGMDIDGARQLAERVLAGARSSEMLKRHGVTVSAGVTVWKANDLPEDLLSRADKALYAAKRGGGDTVASRG
jgi:diguanylate cyclase (GGDEF)-like protein/PAS domain S-box-containing protein